MGRIAFTSALLIVLIGCGVAEAPPPPAAEVALPEAAPGGTSGSSAALQDLPPARPRGAAEVAPRAASAAQRGFPFGEARAEWIPATPWNYDRGRFGEPVRFIVIHYTAISYERTLRAFTSPASRVSAHYVVRHDGHVTQMVSEDDTAWQAGHYWYNVRSVGIEIELAPGESNDAFTPEQYYATAALACGISARHGVPLDRVHVVGHNEIPRTGKIDPGPTWGWPHFMYLTSLCAPPTAGGLRAGFVSQTAFPDLATDEFATFSVTLRNDGAVAWRKGTSSEVRLGLVGASGDPALVGHRWPMPDRPAVQEEELVPPGGTATFTLTVRGGTPGEFLLRLRPVVDGVAWLPDLGLYTIVQVHDLDKVGAAGALDE
ncbi:MAG: N-acetylmuramoyl-L-alanine amidase [Candidatus Limnocylindria bacterium]